MFLIPLATSLHEVAYTTFWEVVFLYHDKPHLVNRRLAGAQHVLFLKVHFHSDTIKTLSELLTRTSILYEVRKLKELSPQYITEDLIKSILEPYDKKVSLEWSSVDEFQLCDDGVFVSVKILFPRQRCYDNCVEVSLLDKKNNTATFLAVIELDRKAVAPTFPYVLECLSSGYRICVDVEHADTATAVWLVDHLFMKLENWIENSYRGSDNIINSLSLVPIDEYTKLYQKLKEKYGEELVTAWPEKTDPLKYVYEDLAIATYLISFWRTLDPNFKPTFVDLGCGNGLLVHVLISEGFRGYGIDVRKRKIWDWYPSSTILKVKTITPSESSLFPDADWIIGNHSDELTPWIPVITARSSYKTNFFLLPCCCYEFSGKKYVRKNAAVSSYAEYLVYIQEIARKCGINVMIDKLRIPSTKRTCLVSVGRSYEPDEFEKIDKCISNLICKDSSTRTSIWIDNFQARSDIEPVRNCTQLDKNLIANIIKKTLHVLLSYEHFQTTTSGGSWNKGGNISISDLAKLVSDELKLLKNENGGLQTLLRNHRYIFEVKKGVVGLRTPSTLELTTSKYKNKPCWFNINHPQGCFNDSNLCAYKH